MDVGDLMRLGLRLERWPIPNRRPFHRTENVEAPTIVGNIRLNAEVENRPVLDDMLSGRQPFGFRARRAAGQKAPLPCPALLGGGELGRRGSFNRRFVRIGVVSHRTTLARHALSSSAGSVRPAASPGPRDQTGLRRRNTNPSPPADRN